MKKSPVVLGSVLLAFFASCSKKEDPASADADTPKKPENHSQSIPPARPASSPAAASSAQAQDLPSTDGRKALAGSDAAPSATPDAPPVNPGIPDTTQADRQLQRLQRTEQITARFASMDKNGDGNLSKDEVTGRMQRRFDEMDTNKDGVIDAAEQKAAAEQMSQRGGRGGGGGNGGGRRNRGGGGGF